MIHSNGVNQIQGGSYRTTNLTEHTNPTEKLAKIFVGILTVIASVSAVSSFPNKDNIGATSPISKNIIKLRGEIFSVTSKNPSIPFNSTNTTGEITSDPSAGPKVSENENINQTGIAPDSSSSSSSSSESKGTRICQDVALAIMGFIGAVFALGLAIKCCCPDTTRGPG